MSAAIGDYGQADIRFINLDTTQTRLKLSWPGNTQSSLLPKTLMGNYSPITILTGLYKNKMINFSKNWEV